MTRIASAPDWPRPWVLIVGSIHGDEPCGLVAIRAILDDARSGSLRLARGTVITLHGNPAASEAQSRSSPGGTDLNRLFDFRFETELRPDQWLLEHRRALLLRPLVATVDAALDIHSARAPTPPFAICMAGHGSFELAMQLGVSYVTVGWDGPGMLGHQVVLAELSRRGHPGVAVECGSHDDPRACEVAHRIARRFLSVVDLVEGAPEEAPEPATVLRLRDALKRPGSSFRFERPLRGLERLARGELVGSDTNIEVRMRSDCYALMPNDEVAVGDDMLYLAAAEYDGGVTS